MASEQPRPVHANRADQRRADKHPRDWNGNELRNSLSRFEQSQQGTKPAVRASRMAQRRDAIYAEIQRNRRGEYSMPTWVLALVLVLIVAGIMLFVVFG
jgi:hypothetical protein